MSEPLKGLGCGVCQMTFATPELFIEHCRETGHLFGENLGDIAPEDLSDMMEGMRQAIADPDSNILPVELNELIEDVGEEKAAELLDQVARFKRGDRVQ